MTQQQAKAEERAKAIVHEVVQVALNDREAGDDGHCSITRSRNCRMNWRGRSRRCAPIRSDRIRRRSD